MKQVSSNIYDKDYYERVYGNIESQNLNFHESKEYYKDLADMMPLKDSDFVVDYGCGVGNFAFYMAKNFGCRVIGIDYSADAINICNERLKKVNSQTDKPLKLEFHNFNNDQLPLYEDVRAVYMCDVVEHMYDRELESVFVQFKKWNTKDKISVVVHTDNNIYLRFVRPILDLVNLALGFMKFSDLPARKTAEDAVHVNLTNPYLFRRKMLAWGFREVEVRYSFPTRSKIKKQLDRLAPFPLLSDLIHVILSLIPFLSPSFFAVYEAT